MKNYLNKLGFIHKSFFISAILALSCQAHEYNWRDFNRDNYYRKTMHINASSFSSKIYNTLHNLPKEKKLEAAQLLLVELIDTANNYYDNAMPELFDKILELGENPSLNFVIKEKNTSYLNYAIESGITSETLQYLIDKGCSVESLDGKNSLLVVLKQEIDLQKAVHRPKIKRFEILMNANANPHCVSSNGESVTSLLNDFEKSLEKEDFEEKKTSGLEFIEKIKQCVQEVENRKNIWRNKIVQILTNPKLEENYDRFVLAPEYCRKSLSLSRLKVKQ